MFFKGLFKKRQALGLNTEYIRQIADIDVADIDAMIVEGKEIIGFVQKGIDALQQSRKVLEKTKEYAPIK